jgi:hypothetical protein
LFHFPLETSPLGGALLMNCRENERTVSLKDEFKEKMSGSKKESFFDGRRAETGSTRAIIPQTGIRAHDPGRESPRSGRDGRVFCARLSQRAALLPGKKLYWSGRGAEKLELLFLNDARFPCRGTTFSGRGKYRVGRTVLLWNAERRKETGDARCDYLRNSRRADCLVEVVHCDECRAVIGKGTRTVSLFLVLEARRTNR